MAPGFTRSTCTFSAAEEAKSQRTPTRSEDWLPAASSQSSNLVGVRWDFAQSAALKVQVDRVSPGAKNGFLSDVTPAGVGKKVTVVAAGVDFVF